MKRTLLVLALLAINPVSARANGIGVSTSAMVNYGFCNTIAAVSESTDYITPTMKELDDLDYGFGMGEANGMVFIGNYESYDSPKRRADAKRIYYKYNCQIVQLANKYIKEHQAK